MPSKKALIEVTPNLKKRIKRLSDKTESATIKLTSITLIEWALPKFESGEIALAPTKPDMAGSSE